MHLSFTGEVIYWRGPAPFYFVRVPDNESAEIKAIAAHVTYGWGVIPVRAQLGKSEWLTSLFPKDGRYLVPVRTFVQKAEGVEEGQVVTIQLEVGPRKPSPTEELAR